MGMLAVCGSERLAHFPASASFTTYTHSLLPVLLTLTSTPPPITTLTLDVDCTPRRTSRSFAYNSPRGDTCRHEARISGKSASHTRSPNPPHHPHDGHHTERCQESWCAVPSVIAVRQRCAER